MRMYKIDETINEIGQGRDKGETERRGGHLL